MAQKNEAQAKFEEKEALSRVDEIANTMRGWHANV